MFFNFFDVRFNFLTNEHTDMILTIGNRHLNTLRNSMKDKGIELISTGWPRIDLLRPEYKSLYVNNNMPSNYYFILIYLIFITSKVSKCFSTKYNKDVLFR